MIRVQLNDEKRKELKTLRNTRSSLGERAHYILLSDKGCHVKDIAKRGSSVKRVPHIESLA